MNTNTRAWWLAAGLAGALVVVGCSSPAGPSSTSADAQGPAVGAQGPAVGEVPFTAAAAGSPDDFAGRGWECRTSPVPGRIACSPPNQGFPAVPPPAERPATYQLKAWQDGTYAGTILLIRPDLYHGQTCESTGEPYIYRPVIGYYECLHGVGE
jgi:hypothetical protein